MIWIISVFGWRNQWWYEYYLTLSCNTKLQWDFEDWEFGTSYFDWLWLWSGSWFTYADSGVYLAEKMNRYLGEHWKSFTSRNYFDRSGVFISVVWSGPLIFISIVSVVSKNLAYPNVKVSVHYIQLFICNLAYICCLSFYSLIIPD